MILKLFYMYITIFHSNPEMEPETSATLKTDVLVCLWLCAYKRGL